MRMRILIAVIAVLAGSCSVLAATDDDCCVGRVGDANVSGDDEPTIGDVSVLIDAKFITGACDGILNCLTEADVNQSGGASPTCDDITIGDISILIDYLFISGSSIGLTECLSSTVTDIDGNVYQTVTIGTQVWMAANLRVTHYRNGEDIPNVTEGPTWAALTTGAYCEYNNDANNVATYGRLYNWYAAVDSRNIAPIGWHVASNAEWKQLEMYLGMSQFQADSSGWRGTTEGGKLKEAGYVHWTSPNTGATNESGFAALPGGYRLNYGAYYGMSNDAIFWSSTERGSITAWSRALSYGSSVVGCNGNYKEDGFSVRCVKD
jgi:uncharacterized protein (TIGR02145 family)